MNRPLRYTFVLPVAILASCLHRTEAPSGPPLPTGRYLPTTFPSTEVSLVGNFPCALVATPDGRLAVTTDLGGRESLTVLRTADAKALSHVDYNPPSVGGDRSLSLYFGLALEPADGGGYTLYA